MSSSSTLSPTSAPAFSAESSRPRFEATEPDAVESDKRPSDTTRCFPRTLEEAFGGSTWLEPPTPSPGGRFAVLCMVIAAASAIALLLLLITRP